ncbi:hypothetical protein SUGI_0121130 [Cryptomeria japonica]|nr:hypothetical protein SUGI_0121130 [Cryptomeria japonica]
MQINLLESSQVLEEGVLPFDHPTRSADGAKASIAEHDSDVLDTLLLENYTIKVLDNDLVLPGTCSWVERLCRLLFQNGFPPVYVMKLDNAVIELFPVKPGKIDINAMRMTIIICLMTRLIIHDAVHAN